MPSFSLIWSVLNYCVVREAVMGPGLADRPLEDIAHSLLLTREDFQQLRYYASLEPALQSQDAGTLFTMLARELHSSTWFLLAGDEQIVQTHRGTRPGGALADIIFNVLFCKVLERRAFGPLADAVPVVPCNGHRAPFAVAAPAVPSPQKVGTLSMRTTLPLLLSARRPADCKRRSEVRLLLPSTPLGPTVCGPISDRRKPRRSFRPSVEAPEP